MNITRENYEEWLLLYVDNELSLAERIIVDDFLAANPDLQQELEMLQQSSFQPDEEIEFPAKSLLLKSTQNLLINEENCEQYFVLYADDELSNTQKAEVEDFVYHHPVFQASFELIQQARLSADTSIVFPDKKLLYRKENSRRVIMIRWYRIAAAAVLVLLIGGAGYKFLTNKGSVTEIANRNGKAAEKNTGLAVMDSVEPGAPEVSNQKRLAEIQPEPQIAAATDLKKGAGGIDMADKKATANPSVQIAPVVKQIPTTAPDNPVVIAANDPANNSSKNIAEQGNIRVPSNVTQSDALSEQPVSGTINNSSPGKNALKNSDMAVLADHSYDLVADEDIEIQPAGKKNKMRGLFRKVSRVFDKAASADDDENTKGNIRIANFEIALK